MVHCVPASHAVDILAVEPDIRFVHLPSMVLLNHRHPFRIGRGGHATRIDLAGMEECVAAIQLLRHYHILTDKPIRVRVQVVVTANTR